MRCPSCGHENPANSKFCLQCGGQLASQCAECGVVLPPGSKFCNECGQPVEQGIPQPVTPDPRSYTPKHLAEKILSSRSALEGERKQVTVLFVDIQGSVALSESVDPEKLHKIMDRFFVILADGVHRFEGTVNQYTGDGIMALFGAPIAHEDHARRACYAALRLTDELRRYADELRVDQGLNFAVRMGLNSGEVVVGKIGDDLRMDYTAQGHTVGLAARMEQIAAPDRVNLTEHTARLVEGFFRLRDLGPHAIKGGQDPLRVHELEGVGLLRTRLDVSQARGFSRFVGRAHEMQMLETALAQALDGHGQVVGIVGEAGVGKSRLCLEFVDQCRARETSVHEAHCPAHGKMLPFVAALELFRTYFGIAEQDDDIEARKKIAGTLLLLDEQFREVLPLVFDFLGVPDPQHPVPRMDPEARQRQLFAFLRQLVERRSAQEPAVLLLDDVHWIDMGSDAFLAQMVEAVNGTRTLLLVNFRPEYDAPWMARSYYQQMPLLPLTLQGTEELLVDLLGRDPSLTGLADRIRERTGGNPFFIEEVVQSLVESGRLTGARGAYQLPESLATLAIPATVQVVLSARIDRLAEREKNLLQTAAVIGKEFSESVLRQVAALPDAELSEALAILASTEFVYQRSLYPEAEYAFKHPLTHEVAYTSQLSERRTQVHRAVAKTMAQLYAEKLDEQAALVAHHWGEAGEALEAARWHGRAAEWAGTSNLTEALRHWRQVRALLEAIPESAETMSLGVAARIQILNVGWRLGPSEEEAAVTFAEGKTLAERSGNLRSLARLTAAYGNVIGLAGDAKEYVRYTTEACCVADQTNDEGLQLACRGPYITALFHAGRLKEALLCAEYVLEQGSQDARLGADIFGYSPYIFALWIRALISLRMGRCHDAEANLDRAVRLARQHGEAENLCWASTVYVSLARITGHSEGALVHARNAVEIAEKTASPLSRVFAYSMLGVAYTLTGDCSQAVGSIERGLNLARETRTGLQDETQILVGLAAVYLGLGSGDRAQATADEAVTVARRQGARSQECLAHLTRARVLLRTEGASASREIQTALDDAERLVEETGARGYEPFIHDERANLARLTGNGTTADREFREAHRLFTEMGATGHAERLAKELP